MVGKGSIVAILSSHLYLKYHRIFITSMLSSKLLKILNYCTEVRLSWVKIKKISQRVNQHINYMFNFNDIYGAETEPEKMDQTQVRNY